MRTEPHDPWGSMLSMMGMYYEYVAPGRSTIGVRACVECDEDVGWPASVKGRRITPGPGS